MQMGEHILTDMNISSNTLIEKSEENSNEYVVKTIVGGMLVLIASCLLNELGLFRTDKTLMRYATIAVCLITAFIEIYIRTFKHSRLPISKYVVVGATVIVTLVETSLLSFFAVPLLVYPLLAGTHYHSKRVNAYAIGGSLLCAILAPVISYKLHTWDIKYFLWLIHTADESLIPMEIIEKGLAGTPLPGKSGVFFFIAVPNALYIMLLGILSFTVNISRRRRQEKEISTIISIQDKMLYSMADIIENRDFSTGGHVKRTSELVKIMTDYLREHPIEVEGVAPRDEFYEAMIKGAPLHDLGKITISDTILCKPGLLTDDEFEKIKSHPEQSVKIINQVLGGIEDTYLLEVSKNIALYHHEKFNGKGYPDGLSGTSIPLESRIMAIADVYDALVSERCYKQPVSHETAKEIILESMGTHFDPALRDCFEASCERFIQFYES